MTIRDTYLGETDVLPLEQVYLQLALSHEPWYVGPHLQVCHIARSPRVARVVREEDGSLSLVLTSLIRGRGAVGGHPGGLEVIE